MKPIFGFIAGFLAVLALLLLLSWAFMGNDFFMYKFFAPKMENVRRETFENTKSYNQGMVQEIRNYQAEYAIADSVKRIALASVILHEVADYSDDKLPDDVKVFIQMLRDKQNKIQ